MQTNLYCEKCGGKNVKETIVPKIEKKENSISIADYNGPSMITTLGYNPIVYEVTCMNCGNSKMITPGFNAYPANLSNSTNYVDGSAHTARNPGVFI